MYEDLTAQVRKTKSGLEKVPSIHPGLHSQAGYAFSKEQVIVNRMSLN